MKNFLDGWRPYVLSILRIVTAFLFMQHGGQKIFGFPAPQRHEFDLFPSSGVAGTLELFGGFLILIGLFTWPVAFVLSGLMAFAYFIAHAPKDFWLLLNGSELAVMWSFLFLYFVFTGSGKWSIDYLIAKK